MSVSSNLEQKGNQNRSQSYASGDPSVDSNDHKLHIIDNTTDGDDNHTPLPPIPSQIYRKSNKYCANAINVSYFQNYHARHSNIPSQMHNVLDRIENDLLRIFRDHILKNTNRAKYLYILVLEIHKDIIKYHSKFILPFISHKLCELNDALASITRLFERFRRSKQSMSIQRKHMKTLQDDIDLYITKIEEYKFIISRGLNQSKQLLKTFNRNLKLLSFWIGLFEVNDNELQYESMTWYEFVTKIRSNKSCRKLKRFPVKEMIPILKQKYNVHYTQTSITAAQFVEYLRRYRYAVSEWAKATYMHIYIEQQIAIRCKQSRQYLVSPDSAARSSLSSESSRALDPELSDEDEVDEDEIDDMVDIPDPIWDRTLSVPSPRTQAFIEKHSRQKTEITHVHEHKFPKSLSFSVSQSLNKPKYTHKQHKNHSQPKLKTLSVNPLSPIPQKQILVLNTSNGNVSRQSTQSTPSQRRKRFKFNSKPPKMPRSKSWFEDKPTESCESGESVIDINEFPIDELPYSPRVSSPAPPHDREPFSIITLTEASEDLQRKQIIYHGLFCVYSPYMKSYIDIAGILTMDRLYLVSAIKYQIWQEFRERTKMDTLINGRIKNEDENISEEMAKQLIENMDIMDPERSSRLLEYFVDYTKKEIMLSMLLNTLGRNKMRKLSTYFDLDEDMYGANAINDCLLMKEAAKETKYIQIKGVNDANIVPSASRGKLLEYILGDIEWIQDEIQQDDIVITLCDYHYKDRILKELNDRKTLYFQENGLLHWDAVEISEYERNKIKYTFTEIQAIDLHEYECVVAVNRYDRADSFGFCLHHRNEEDNMMVRMASNNTRYEWMTHVDYVLHCIKRKKNEAMTIKDDVYNDNIILNNSSFIDFDNDDYSEIKEEEEKVLNDNDVITAYNPTKEKLINDFGENKSDKSDTETETDTNTYSTHFNFGIYLNYWQHGFENSVIAKYDTLRDELLNNKISCITEEDFYSLYEQCTRLFKMRGFQIKAQTIGPNNTKFNVARGSSISINHLIALKVYTDYTKTQQLFKKHCRRYNEDESMQQFIRRNCEIAHWCRYLRESTTFFGTKMRFKYVYTGLKDKLIFPSLTQNFYCPLSTTSSVIIAKTYCDDHGVIIKLKAAHGKSRYFDVSWLSRYKFEEERLIMGAQMKICDIMIDCESGKGYIAALHLLEQILNGYEIVTEREIEDELYKMIAHILGLDHDDDPIPEYIDKLLMKRIEKMRQRMRYKDELKRLWINKTGIIRLRNEGLKCLFGGCLLEGLVDVHHDWCGLFFSHFGINLTDINMVTRFSWTIDVEYETFREMKARKFMQSPAIVYNINEREQIVFHLTCYPKYTHEKQKCALFLHLQSKPDYIESIKVEYDLLCDWGGKIKYQHVMIPQVLKKDKMYCGCQTFASNKIKHGYIWWNIGIKVIEVKYNDIRRNSVHPYKEHWSDSELSELQQSPSELMELVRVMAQQCQAANIRQEELRSQINRLCEENKQLKMNAINQNIRSIMMKSKKTEAYI